jgi:hypothetical protein
LTWDRYANDGSAVITGVEGAALKLGTAIAKYGATTWLQRRKAKKVRAASLTELAAAELTSPLQQNKLVNLVDRIGNQVAEQLAPVLATRFGSLPPNEIEAAIDAVVDVLAEADLSDKAFLAADADAEELARRLRAQFDGPRRALLAADAVPLYELALDLACRHLVQVVRHLPSFQQAALAEVLARLTTQTDHLETLLSRVPTTSLRAPSGTAHDDEFRTEYLRALVNKLDRLELLGLPMDEQPSLALTIAYLSLSASDEGGTRRRERRIRSQDKKALQTEGIQVEDAISRGSRALIRGDAGSGKTTLLDWLAVKAARGELTGSLVKWNHLVPFSIRLRSFADGELPEVERWVRHAVPLVADLKPDGWVRRQLDAGRAWLLVDGVDEVPAHRRRAVRNWLRELLGNFPQLRVVVTSRPAAVDKRWLDDDGFSSIELEPMSKENVNAFIERWHDAAAGTAHDVPAAHRRMRGQLEQPHLRELASTPLLCAMLCALNLTHRSELPRNRMDLYAKALSMLLHLRDRERGISGLLDDTGKRVVLRDLAWRLTLANRIEFDHQKALEFLTNKLPSMPAKTDPKELLKHLLERSGVLRTPVPGKVDFVHRTFQEYLAADEAVQWNHEATVVAHAHLDTWRETVVMSCGHANAQQATELLTGILDRADNEPNNARALRLVAAACMETAQDLKPEIRARLDAMVHDKLVPPRSLRETQSLASVGHHILRHLPHDLTSLSNAQASATTRVAALTGDSEALPLLARYARDGRADVQAEIANGWHYFDPEKYARVVLADANLYAGRIKVESRQMLPYLRYLNKLTATNVRLPSSEPITELGFLSEVANLQELAAFVEEGAAIDLGPLVDHHSHITDLSLRDAGEFAAVSSLARLTGLEFLILEQNKPWSDLSFLSSLRELQFLVTSVHDDLDFAVLGQIPRLSHLYLSDLSSRSFEMISRCDKVKTVDFAGDGPICIGEVLPKFPVVREIILRGFEVDFVGAAGASLDQLTLYGCLIEDLDPIQAWAKIGMLELVDSLNEPDLSPLAEVDMELSLSRSDAYRGVGNLTSRVRVTYLY